MDPASDPPAIFEKVPVIAALDALSQESFFIKELMQQINNEPQYFQGLTISAAKIRAAFDDLVAANYVVKTGRKHKTAARLLDLISNTQAEQDPAEGDDDEAYKCELYTTVAKSLTSNNDNHNQTNGTNTRSQAGRRKRRSSVTHSSSTTTEDGHGDIRLLPEDEIVEVEVVVQKTPRRAKRVRFSDPGPALLSTGLTPAIRRTSIGPNVQPSPSRASSRKALKTAVSRRRSLPVTSSTLGAEHASSSTPFSGTMQFIPMRQVLSERVRRRLARNKLSEEVNEIEHEKREAAKQKRDTVRKLKEQVAAKDRQLGELQEEIEITRQFAIEVNTPASSQEADRDNKVKELEEELARLNNEIGKHRGNTLDPYAMNEDLNDYHDVDDDDDDFMIVQADGFDHNMTGVDPTEDGHRHASLSPSANQVSMGTECEMAEAQTPVNFPDDRVEEQRQQIELLKTNIKSLHALVEDRDNTQQRLLSKLHHFLSADKQYSDDANLDAALDSVLTNLVLAQSKSDEAQATIHAIHAEVSELGFDGNGIEEILASIGEQFRQARLDLEYLSPGENTEGFENSKLLSMLVDRVRTLMENVRDGKQQLEFQVQKETALQEQLDGFRRELSSTEIKISQLETNVDEKDRSLEKLHRALDGYRDEVKGLETLISNLDAENQKTVSQLRKEMDEAVHDLEGKLGEETTSRQTAEEDMQQKRTLLTELEARLIAVMGQLEETRTALRITKAEKHDIIQRLENKYQELEEKSRGDINQREESILQLRGHMESLETALNEAKISNATLTASNTGLEAQLVAEVNRGIHVVENLQADMRISMSEREDTIRSLEGRIRDLDSQYLSDINQRNGQIAELQSEMEFVKSAMADAESSIANLTASKNDLEVRLLEETERGIHAIKSTQAEMLRRLCEKEETIQRLQSESQELIEQHRIDLNSHDNTIVELRSQIAGLQSTLEDAQLSIENLKSSKANLEKQLIEERDLGASVAEAMQAEMMKPLARMGEMKNKYLRGIKLRRLRLSNDQNVGNSEDTDDSYENGLSPLTPSSIVKFAPDLVKSKGRRRYDSGIVVTEEDDEGELTG